jgi:hypothetical protein
MIDPTPLPHWAHGLKEAAAKITDPQARFDLYWKNGNYLLQKRSLWNRITAWWSSFTRIETSLALACKIATMVHKNILILNHLPFLSLSNWYLPLATAIDPSHRRDGYRVLHHELSSRLPAYTTSSPIEDPELSDSERTPLLIS